MSYPDWKNNQVFIEFNKAITPPKDLASDENSNYPFRSLFVKLLKKSSKCRKVILWSTSNFIKSNRLGYGVKIIALPKSPIYWQELTGNPKANRPNLPNLCHFIEKVRSKISMILMMAVRYI